MGLSDKLFISGTIEERTIELGDGTKETLFFKHLPNTAFERYAIWVNSADEDTMATAAARLVSMGLCEPDGSPALTFERAQTLKRDVLKRVFRALIEVNEPTKAKTDELGNV